jgi:hypothetical protein
VLCPSLDRLLVCTLTGKLGIWNVRDSSCFILESLTDVSEMLLQIFQDLTSRQIHVSMISPMDNIYVAKHLSVHEGGFVSRHYIQSESCTLLVWKQLDSRLESDLSAPSFQIVSMIYLPICPARMPCIHFDGRRLIAFARDHICFLVLIYHIRFGDDDDDFMFTSSPGRASLPGAQEHGNVYNVIRTPPYVRFACRIRHPSLGGLHRGKLDLMTTTAPPTKHWINPTADKRAESTCHFPPLRLKAGTTTVKSVQVPNESSILTVNLQPYA